jgi:hypothetical protein
MNEIILKDLFDIFTLWKLNSSPGNTKPRTCDHPTSLFDVANTKCRLSHMLRHCSIRSSYREDRTDHTLRHSQVIIPSSLQLPPQSYMKRSSVVKSEDLLCSSPWRQSSMRHADPSVMRNLINVPQVRTQYAGYTHTMPTICRTDAHGIISTSRKYEILPSRCTPRPYVKAYQMSKIIPP